MAWIKLQKTLAIITLGGMPLSTVSSCDYGPGGGDFYLDRNVGVPYYTGDDYYGHDVIIEDTYYEEEVYYEDEYYYEDDYYVDEYYYEDDSWYDWFDWF